ncbi:unnamed protein product, partial [Polarella glacialis]
ATGFEEDLAVNQEIVAQLRSALSQSYSKCEAIKRVLLELEADATGDRAMLDQHSQDPESDAFSFPALRTRVQVCWANVLSSVESQQKLKIFLQERQKSLLEKKSGLVMQVEELSARRLELDKELAEVSRMEAERDELFRREVELEHGVSEARRRVRDLELGRKALQERQAERQIRRRLFGGGSASSPRGSPPPGVVAFTISTGRQDPLLSGRSDGRWQGCRRSSCSIM